MAHSRATLCLDIDTNDLCEARIAREVSNARQLMFKIGDCTAQLNFSAVGLIWETTTEDDFYTTVEAIREALLEM